VFLCPDESALFARGEISRPELDTTLRQLGMSA
jgi:hypothetical protein